MPNYRVYYPVHYIAIGPVSTASGLPVHGLQSVNLTTTFDLENVFELGQLEVYENIENLPNVELTAEKVIDGYPLIYHLATRAATARSLVNRTTGQSDVFLSIFADTNDNSSGAPLVQAYCSGMYVNALTYTLPVTGNATESVTLVGNDKVWRTSGFAFNGHFTGNDSPAAGTGVQRRENIKMGAAPTGSIWPRIVPGVTVVTGSGYNVETAGVFGAHIQDVTITTTLGREDLFELGRLKPYYRYANFPVAVDCTINISPGGTNPGDGVNAVGSGGNISDEPIMIKLDDSTLFDLGNKNKLQSITYSGGDSGGGVVTVAYAFQNFNKLDIFSPNDPAAVA